MRALKRWAPLALAVVICVVWGLGWGLFIHKRMEPYHASVVPKGTAWQSPEGARYTVLASEQVTEVEGFDGVKKTPEGSVSVLVQVRVQNATADTGCVFDLLGSGRELWRYSSDWVPRPADNREKYPLCPPDDSRGAEFTYWASYLVPKDRVDGIVGLFKDTLTYRKNPALAIS